MIDLEEKDVGGPLSNFNHTKPNRDGMLKLVLSLNRQLDDALRLRDDILKQSFDTYWPMFEKGFKAAVDAHPPQHAPEPRPDGEILAEILAAVRHLASRGDTLRETRRLQDDEVRLTTVADDAERILSAVEIKQLARTLHRDGKGTNEIVDVLSRLGVLRQDALALAMYAHLSEGFATPSRPA